MEHWLTLGQCQPTQEWQQGKYAAGLHCVGSWVSSLALLCSGALLLLWVEWHVLYWRDLLCRIQPYGLVIATVTCTCELPLGAKGQQEARSLASYVLLWGILWLMTTLSVSNL